MSAIDPSTPLGSIAVNVIAGLVVAVLLAGLAWVAGPLKWFIQNRRLKELLLSGRRFVFVFNPTTEKAKLVTFEADGKVGEGRNENEHTWKIAKGALEIFAADGKIYSRFRHDKASGHLKHTNDTDTRSIHGQYFQPDFLHWNKPAQQGAPADGPASRARG